MTRLTRSEQDRKIIMIKDPVELAMGPEDILQPTQMSTGHDVETYAHAIRGVLRRAPSIIGSGETRGMANL